MAYFRFNNDIDKVTERELVYDIVERMTLGDDLTEGTNTLWAKGTFITDIWKKIAYMLPPTVTLNILKIKTGVIDIAAGAKTGSVIISDLTNREVLLAISEQNGCDIKETLDTFITGNDLTVTLTVDTPYTRPEHIKVYAY